jgi:hypothetical protein
MVLHNFVSRLHKVCDRPGHHTEHVYGVKKLIFQVCRTIYERFTQLRLKTNKIYRFQRARWQFEMVFVFLIFAIAFQFCFRIYH